MNKSSPLTQSFKLSAVFLCAVNILLIFVGIFLNSVVVLSLLGSQLRRKLCYFTILILACCDLAVVLVFHPLIIFGVISRWVFTSCAEKNPGEQFFHFFVMSLAALITMTFERYFALEHPFVHERLITRSKLMAVFVNSLIPKIIYYTYLYLR